MSPNVPATTHPDHDGIEELDNPLPNWWLATLFATIVFGFGYWLYYQTFERPGAREKLVAEEAEATRRAAAAAPVTDELIATLAKDPTVLQGAATIFQAQCVACHGAHAEGKIGPNLTDEWWLHGDKPKEIHHTIAAGVTQKGMPSWEPVLGPEKVKWLAAYVVSLRNTHAPGGKAPEGQKSGE